ILGVAGPIALFVASGFEHSVAKMFILPMGLIIKYGAGDAFWAGEAITAAGVDVDSFAAITVGAVLWANLVPAIRGDIVGGAAFLGPSFWSASRRDDIKAQEQAARAEDSQHPAR